MRLGFMCGTAKNKAYTIDQYIDEVKAAEALGFDQAWMAQVFSTDAISMLTVLGRETTTIGLGTAVTPSFPRHPTSLAIQALTANAASQGRFDLGLGLSHKMVIEDMYGIPYDKPATHMREYLEVLMPLVRGEACAFEGEQYRVHAQMKIPDAPSVTVIVAALGPKMLELAGRLADGTTTWMTGLRTLETHTIPRITKAAEEAGKPSPRIVASFPIVLTDDAGKAREFMAKRMAVYRHIPSYRKMLDLEGIESPGDIAMVGDEAGLREQLQQLKAIGVTDFNAFCFPVDDGVVERTMAFLASEKSALHAS
jgi:F420-dependent oxidoreductase-like protein